MHLTIEQLVDEEPFVAEPVRRGTIAPTASMPSAERRAKPNRAQVYEGIDRKHIHQSTQTR